MYAYGTFYDRIGDDRVKVKIDDKDVKMLVKLSKLDDDEEFEDYAEEMYHERLGSICASVAITGLAGHVRENKKATGIFVSDEEEWLIAYGSNEEKVKKAYTKAAEQYADAYDDDWEE